MKKFDAILVGIVGVIFVFGLIALGSASVPLAIERFQDPFYYLKHQLFFGVLPGIAAFFIFSRMDYRQWRRHPWTLAAIVLVLLAMVFIPGVGASFGHARSWVQLGPLTFQPSEFAKLLFIMTTAGLLVRARERGGMRRAPSRSPTGSSAGVRSGSVGDGMGRDTLIALGAFLFSTLFLLAMEPDMGGAGIFAATAVAMYFLAGGAMAHIAIFGVAGAAFFFVLAKISPYRAARFMTFLHPELDPQGIGYHINQALLAIGSGGLLGVGLGHSRQKFQYLPEVIGDSIFAVIAEELGFLVAAGLVVLFLALIARAIKIALDADDFGRLVAGGIAAWFGVQIFANIGSMIGLVPLTGITLPFVSYGGSSLVVSLAAVGVLTNISRNT